MKNDMPVTETASAARSSAKRPEASSGPTTVQAALQESFGGSSSSSAGQAHRDQLEQQFDEEFSKHISKKNKLATYGLGALGAGLGGAVGFVAAPVVLPGLAVAGLLGGYFGGKHLGKQELQRHGARGSGSAEADEGGGRPTLRRLRYLAKWGHFQLVDSEEATVDQRCAVLDEVAGSFSPWVQKIYLLRAKGMTAETDPEVFEVMQHLAPLYNLVQRKAAVDVVLESAKCTQAAFDDRAADVACVERCRVLFPTIMETISTLDRISAATRALLPREGAPMQEDSEVFAVQRKQRQHRLQRIVNAIREVLERSDVQEAMADPHCLQRQNSASPSTLEAQACSDKGFELPPEGVENEPHTDDDLDGEADYYSAGSGDEAPIPPLRRVLSSRSQQGGSPVRRAAGMTASCARRIESFPRGSENHTWTDWEASRCKVRSKTYLRDKKKEPSDSAMLVLVNTDIMLIGEDGPVKNVTKHPSFFPAHHRRETGDKRFLFVQNWLFPPYQAVMTCALNPDAAWLCDGSSAQARVWKTFLEADNETRKRLFKVAMVIEQGPWLVRQTMPTIPVLIGSKVKMESQHEPGDYLELTFDTSSGGNVERMGVATCCKALSRLQLVYSCIIEGQKPEHLPENVLFSAAMLNLDPSKLFAPALEF